MFLDVQDGATAIMVAAENGHKDVVELLIASGADVKHQKQVRIDLDLVTCSPFYCGRKQMDGSKHGGCYSQN